MTVYRRQTRELFFYEEKYNEELNFVRGESCTWLIGVIVNRAWAGEGEGKGGGEG